MLDITFNFNADTPEGKDPDARSPTLRKYHKLLWSKALPSGEKFDLVDSQPGCYLFHESILGRFVLTSDAITHSYRTTKRLSHVLKEVPPAVVDQLYDLGCTIGAYIIFPGNRIDGKRTINGERGCCPKVRDRFDITLECIRRHYLNEESPLSAVLQRYKDFFLLFGDFRGYVDFFLLGQRSNVSQ